jgi:hypothetical protein
LASSFSGTGLLASDTAGIAILGSINATNTSAIVAENLASGGVVVWGQAVGTNSAALKGIVSPAGAGCAVYGDNNSSQGWAGYFNGNVYSTGAYRSSDARLKKNVETIGYGLTELLRLRPVSYQWTTGDDSVHLGLIAQEVRGVVPEIVHQDGASSTLSIEYNELIPIAISAIQAQQLTIDQRESRLRTLELRSGKSAASSDLGAIGGGAALGVLPLGFVVARRLQIKRSKIKNNADRKQVQS